jgi:hypothetical protein
MKWARIIFDFYLDASVHVALALLSLLYGTALSLNISPDRHLALFLFFGAIGGYNFIKYGVEAEKYIWVVKKYHKYIQIISLISCTLALYHAFFLNFRTWIAMLTLLILTGLYALPVLPGAKNLRSLAGFKIFLVALVWTGATVILPVTESTGTLSWDVGIESLQRFGLVLLLMLPFDIRDLAHDQLALKSLPQQFGVYNTKIFGAMATIPFFLLTFFKDDVPWHEIMGKGILFLAVAIVLLATPKHQSKYFASFWVEAIPIFWWLVLLLLPF